MAWSSRGVRIAALLVRIALGAVFVYAAWVKLFVFECDQFPACFWRGSAHLSLQPWQLFALAVAKYEIVSPAVAGLVARALPWFELLIGLMLIAGRGLRISAAATSALLIFFFALIVRSYAKGLDISCGCFSNDEKITWLTMLRDGSMLAGSLLLTAFAFRSRRKAA